MTEEGKVCRELEIKQDGLTEMERSTGREQQTQHWGGIFLIAVEVRTGDRPITGERERQMKPWKKTHIPKCL